MKKSESIFTDKNPMQLCNSTIESHREICCKLEIFDSYETELAKRGAKGGEGTLESSKHLLTRFLNSAARTQLAILPLEGDLPEINEELVAQLSAKNLYIIDIASGHGAGTLSIINSIHYLRTKDEAFPTDPLDIDIHALDFSESSLSYYENLIEILRPDHLKVGITIKLHKHVVNLKSDEHIKAVVENIKISIGKNPQYLLTCSAISGVQRAAFQESFARSYSYIITEFREENSLFFWVEPQTPGDWIRESWQELATEQKIEYPSAGCKTKNIRFHWSDPHTKSVLHADTEYLLMGLAT